MQNLALVVPMRALVVFPGSIRAVALGRPASVQSALRHLESGTPLVLVPQLDAEQLDPLTADLTAHGVVAHVLRVTTLPDGSVRLLIEGGERVRVLGPLELVEGALTAPFAPVLERQADPVHMAALSEQLADMFREWQLAQGLHGHEAELIAADRNDPARVADQVAAQLPLSHEDQLALIEVPDTLDRLAEVSDLMARELAKQRITTDINAKVTAAMDKSNREYHVREQIKVLQEELGDRAGPAADADRFEERLKELGLPQTSLEEALREVDRLRRVHVDAAEYTIIRTWLETVCDMPWTTATDDNADLADALSVLDADHHGLDKVKERIIEYLAVRQLNPNSKGPILCFVGPPGVGKTSLGRSIAHALGRNYARIALGGVKDETEIRGHRRTYIGALPGRIVRALIRAGTRNPVLVLDELDKVGTDPHRGDPASALLEVLDGEQNSAFTDHYLDIPVDLSQVMFIATANLEEPIPPALHDRLEIIRIGGYIEEEKVKIATQHLLPRQAQEHGLNKGKLALTEAAIVEVIRDHTREAGVRSLDRKLATVHRKVARRIVEGKAKKVRIDAGALKEYLGPPRYFPEPVERVDQPGVVVGLAWTAVGGDILFIEATKMPGKHSLKLTGSLGDVMKESVEAAMSWLRTHAAEYDLKPDAFDAAFHLHVPAGAIPKDGPSAGVTMATSLASLVSGRKVKPSLAMTGEMTLRGKVLPVGGVKEKVLAARRAGVTTVILPKRNETDLEDVPAPLRDDLTFHFVETVQQVLELALE